MGRSFTCGLIILACGTAAAFPLRAQLVASDGFQDIISRHISASALGAPTVPGLPDFLLTTIEAANDPVTPGIAGPLVSTPTPPAVPVVPRRSYASVMARERAPLGQVIAAHMEFYPSHDYLRILHTPNRHPLVRPPFNLRIKARTPSTNIPGVVSATAARLYVCDSSIASVIDWYSRSYNIEFRVITIPFAEGRDGELMTLAHGVKRFKNSVVSVMIWNPTVTTRRRRAASVNHSTSVEVEERAFRSREDLVVQGPDAVVEFTWKVPYRALIQQASAKYQIDPYFLAALVQQESGFNASAMSVDSAMGLTQMIPSTAAMMGVSNPNDPKQSIDGGARYLQRLLRRFKGDPQLALAGYNAGPGNVIKYGGIPPFAETREYVRRIMARYRERAAGRAARKARVVARG